MKKHKPKNKKPDYKAWDRAMETYAIERSLDYKSRERGLCPGISHRNWGKCK